MRGRIIPDIAFIDDTCQPDELEAKMIEWPLSINDMTFRSTGFSLVLVTISLLGHHVSLCLSDITNYATDWFREDNASLSRALHLRDTSTLHMYNPFTPHFQLHYPHYHFMQVSQNDTYSTQPTTTAGQ